MNSLIRFLIGLTCCFSFLLAAAESQKPLVLVMGEDSYPYQFVSDNGEPKGLLVDLWREWASQTHTPVVFVVRHWKDSLIQLAEGDADIHLGMGITDERRELFDFASPITSVSTYLYLRNNLKDKTAFSQLLPYRIGVVRGSSHQSILSQQVSGLAFSEYSSRAALMDAVLNGEVDIFAGMEGYLKDSVVSRAVLEAFPLDNRILIKKTAIVPAVTKGDSALLEKINTGMSEISQESLEHIEKNWLGYSRDTRTLVIATTNNIEPFVDIGGDGQPHGMYIDIWNLWSKKTGIPVEFKPESMANALDDLKYNRADFHIGYPESDTMKTNYHRAQLLYQVKSRLFSFKQPLSDLAALDGKIVGAVPTAPYIDKLRAALPEVELKLYSGVDQMIEAAQQGHISAFVASSAWTQHYLLKAGAWADFHLYRPLYFTTDIYALTRNEDKGLAQRISAGFELITPAELGRIEAKWVIDSDDHTVADAHQPLKLSAEEQAYLARLPALKMGFLQSWKPMEFEDKQGLFAGINSQISEQIATALNLKLKPVMFTEWNALLTALKRGEIDIAGSVAQTPDREASLLFSESYWPSPWGLVTNLNQVTAFNLAQLSGKRLAIVEDYHLVSNLVSKDYGIELVLVPNTRAGIDAVAQGKADGFIEKVINMSVALMDDDYHSLKMSVLADFSEEQSHFGLHPSLKPLVPIWDKAISQISVEMQQAIYQRWLGNNEQGHSAQLTWRSSFYLLLLLSGVLIALVSWFAFQRGARRHNGLQQQIVKLGHFDTLTGLPNRTLLDDRLEQSMLLHRREMQPFAVLFISFDNMHTVNQQYDHQIGDQVLKLGTSKLKKMIRKSDTLARFGGNEFVLILNRPKDLDKVCQVADGMISAFAAPFAINGDHVALSVSIGIAMYPNEGDTVVELLKVADKHMARAVAQGGNCYRSA
ncbi:transporter substrate-binding domain-containing protein [Shewanella colwelliana]|uniref:transporter substrate-binding domain-containing protein n=1 Tax=Shewanella colwelliana TaxID=23 RepID=UPI00299ED3D7|nr:transporter substrate-binding domain-containing protein [Shewanella colwelliana]MDX1282265.1 transporter substrate-binding domain-containing protein [Shewanella colwelliana]